MPELETKPKQRILVIDDEADIAESIQTVLQKKYTVDILTDPLKIVTGSEAEKYDLFLVDYLMPGLNGLEVYEKLKEFDPDANVCIMTAFELSSSESLKNSVQKLQFPIETHVIKKPFDRKEILDKIEVLLAQKSSF